MGESVFWQGGSFCVLRLDMAKAAMGMVAGYLRIPEEMGKVPWGEFLGEY